MIGSIEKQDLVPRQRTGDCLSIHIPPFLIGRSQSLNFPVRSRASPVSVLQEAFVILAQPEVAISV